VKPVAEPVLATLGLDFERVIGDNRQIDLYSLLGNRDMLVLQGTVWNCSRILSALAIQ
jgi:hypothetical protein